MGRGACPNEREHTSCPASYLAWHEWAEEKAKTHRQVRCPSCGLFKVWVPRTSPKPGESVPYYGPSGWFRPSQARKAHFDPGDGIALCARWMRFNTVGVAGPLDGDRTSPPQDGCATCRKRLDSPFLRVPVG